MTSFPLPIGRVTDQMQSALVVGTLQADQLNLLKVQQQISTGKRLNQASDDPGATVGIMRLNQQVASNTQYSSNLDFASGFLAQADSTLGQVSSLVNQAQSLSNSMVGTTATADQRSAQAQVVNSLLSQLMDLANTQYQGQAVFGGQSGSQNPFVAAGAGYKYVGSTQGQGILTPSGSSLEYTVNGNNVFGGESAQVTGYQTLTPALTATTRLADLAGAGQKGVANGPVNVTVGATTISVDLSQAANVGDVVSIVNAGLAGAGSDATISMVGGSLMVNGDSTQSVTIADTANGTSAADLGLAGTIPTGTAQVGAALQPKITATTTLASLNNGGGIDSSGIVITNGSNTATITLAGLNTVQDLLNAINGSGTNVHATINAAGTGINVLNPVSGSDLKIGENGGNTASELGIRSFSGQTKLADLNSGAGVSPIADTLSGPTGTIIITKTDGTKFTLKVDGLKTPSQLIAAINSATGNATVTAAMNASGNGITLTDTSGGPGNLTVTGGSDFVSNGSLLGIFKAGTGGTLTGSDITFSTDDFRITRQDGTGFSVSLAGPPAATTVQDVINRINTADGNTGANAVTATLNPTGNGIQLSDASAGSATLAVTSVNASTAAQQLGILKTAPSATPGTINGDDTNPVQPQGLFSTLTLLRNALMNNDTAGIQQAAALLETDGQRVVTANGIVGAREQDIQTRKDMVTTEQTQLQSSLSLLQDTDMTSAITQYQTLSTAYQAALQAEAKSQNLSLLDFLK